MPVSVGYYTNTDFSYNHSLGIDDWGVPLEGEAHRGLRHSMERVCEKGYVQVMGVHACTRAWGLSVLFPPGQTDRQTDKQRGNI